MKLKILLMVFVVLFLCSNASAITVDLIQNGDFSNGVANWEIWDFVKGRADTAGEQLNWWVTAAGGTWAGATQYLNTDISTYDSLILKYDVFVKRQNYDSPTGGYPAKFKIWYEDIGGTPRSYAGGFYYQGSGEGAVRGIYLPQNTWYSQYYGDLYTSSNLLALENAPKIISKIDIYGEGDVFEGSADNVQLLASRVNVVPEPASMILFGIGGLVMATIKRRKNA